MGRGLSIQFALDIGPIIYERMYMFSQIASLNDCNPPVFTH